ncbi:MAG: site-specific integrase [Fuerstiella sp.]|nr:site-specific integrase [Fuerstiella sp.]
MAKRAKNEGTIFCRKSDGRWVGRIQIGVDAVTGNKKRKVVYGKTEQEVVGKLAALRMQSGKAIDFERQKDSLAAFLSWWLEYEVKPNRAGKTYLEYELAVRLYIVPFIGGIKLARLNVRDISQWMAAMSRKKFTNNMRKRALRVCRAALNRGIKLQCVDSNPANAVDMPKVRKREIRPLEVSECNSLFAACKDHRLGDAIIVAATTGLRKGEVLALKWAAVNLSEGVLVVRETLEEVAGGLRTKAPKTAAGRRVVTLGAIAVEALKRRRKKALADGMEPSEIPLVFPTTTGTLQRPSNFDRRVWHPIREAAGISDDFTFHDLRHTQASLMIAAGVPMKIVQERLGHSDYTLTANTYSHLMKGAQAEAAEKVDRLFVNVPV